MVESAPATYPDEFLWGVATAGFQVEGGLNGAGEPRNNWAAWEDAGRVERTGRGAAFWDLWQTDLDLAKALGVTAFRMGIEWARVEPVGGRGFDDLALDRYADMLAGARERGLEPVVTLQHFTHPEWLGTDPWLDSAVPERFAHYVAALVEAIGRRLEIRGQAPIRYWVTVNEPNSLCMATYYLKVFPRGPGRGGKRDLSAALAGIMSAHVAAYRAVHDTYDRLRWAPPVVTYNAWACAVYAVDRYLVDLLRPATRGRTRDLAREFRRAVGPVGVVGRVAGFVLGRAVDPAAFVPLTRQLGADEDPLDLLAFDYYHPYLGDYVGWTGRKVHPWEWPADAARLPQFATAWVGPHEDLSLCLLENGIGTRPEPRRGRYRPDGLARPHALQSAISAVDTCLHRGLKISGYFHWSLIDNYEWGSFAPRFGLHAVDLSNGQRLPHDATGADAAGAYRALVQARRNGGATIVR